MADVDIFIQLLFAVIVVGTIIWCVIRKSELYRVPGPPITAVTDLWILWQTYKERRNRLVHDLHLRYGPIVRLSPHEVAIADPGYLKQVYINNFDKSDFYFLFGNYGVQNAFSALTKEDHAPKRRVVHQLYSKSAVTVPSAEASMRERLDRAAGYFDDSASTRESVDILKLFRCVSMDVVTAFQYGNENGTDFIRNDKERDLILGLFKVQTDSWFVGSYLPKLAQYLAPKKAIDSAIFTDKWNLENMKRSGLPEDTVSGRLRKSGFTEIQTASEIEDHVVAGHETSAVAMTYLLWHLALHPEIQKKLQDELKGVLVAGSDIPSASIPPFKEVDKLPYLTAVLQETLRLYSPIPGAQPRLSPPEGFWYSPSSPTYGQKSLKYFIPGGTIVSLQAWTIHRDPNVFADPQKFDPERWINSPQDRLHIMNRSFFAFGSGIRMCLGMNLAMEDMKLVIAYIFSHFTVRVDDERTTDQMRMVDRYTTRPESNTCYMKFEKL
ncbi:cytochrome P450 [Lipomyces arxii]|uniref:cytochrome P450 n=1 Tax=Lipomyces arxii TaxID=56418 RepID=UPI0034CE78DD